MKKVFLPEEAIIRRKKLTSKLQAQLLRNKERSDRKKPISRKDVCSLMRICNGMIRCCNECMNAAK